MTNFKFDQNEFMNEFRFIHLFSGGKAKYSGYLERRVNMGKKKYLRRLANQPKCLSGTEFSKV